MNKKIICVILTVAVIISSISVLALPVNAATYVSVNAIYVSEKGDDGNPGTKDAPLKTLEKARDIVRAMIDGSGLPNGGINVYFRGGTYYFNKTVEFTELDSGTDKNPVIYCAYPGENVIFSGGITLNKSSFTEVKDSSVLEILPEDSKGKVKQINLEEFADKINLTEGKASNTIKLLHLIVNDKYATPARWPNNDKDNVRIEELTENSSYKFNYDEPIKWKNPKDAYIAGWLQNGFFFNYANIKSIDPDKKVINIDEKYQLHLDGYNGQIYYVNLLDELDMENEYYYDSEKKMLYYYPQSSFGRDKIQIALMNDVIFKMTDCSNVVIKDITFEALNNTMPGNVFYLAGGIGGAVDMLEKSHDNFIDSCTFRTIGGRVIWLDGYNNGITSSKFYNCGGAGVGFGASNLENAEKRNNYVVNCDFSNLNFFSKTYNPAVALNGIGNIVAHNRFNNLFQQAMLAYSATDITVEYNEISNCVQQGHDMGTIYSQGRTDNTSFINGYNIYRYNYFHDNAQNNTGAYISKYTYDLYLDQPTIVAKVYGNIFENTNTMGSVYNNGGAFNEINNNIFVNVSRAIYANYDHWLKESSFIKPRTKEQIDDILGKNVNANDSWKSSQINIFADPWLKNYPLLAKVWSEGDATLANKYENNILYNTGNLFDEGGTPPEKNNLSISNDPFVDIDNKDYTIKADSEVFKKNPDFKNIPFDHIGKFDKMLQKKLSKAVALNVGNPLSLVNGSKKQIDKDNINVMPMEKDGRTLVPVRFIAESFGAKVGWDAQTETVTMDIAGKNVKMQVNNKVITVDGVENTLDVPPQIVEGRTLLPLRALVEGIGKNVFWDNRGLIVISDEKDIFDAEYDKHVLTAIIQKIKY